MSENWFETGEKVAVKEAHSSYLSVKGNCIHNNSFLMEEGTDFMIYRENATNGIKLADRNKDFLCV